MACLMESGICLEVYNCMGTPLRKECEQDSMCVCISECVGSRCCLYITLGVRQ